MEYSREFIDDYIEIIRAATLLDRDACLRASVRLGFLSVSLVSLYNCGLIVFVSTVHDD